MKEISTIFVFFIVVALIGLTIYADYWGNRKCREVDGNWILLNGGMYCVDKDFNEIDIYTLKIQ